jgi:hypothetical protein
MAAACGVAANDVAWRRKMVAYREDIEKRRNS